MDSNNKLILVLGGARSGKSAFAERLAAQMGEAVLYVATAQALDGEMKDRIRKHRERRPSHWRTLEAGCNTGTAIRAHARSGETILLDCLTLLVSNIVLSQGEDVTLEKAQPDVDKEIEELLQAARDHDAPVIIVSNEVGLGGVPIYPLGRVYQDLQGWANQQVGNEAGQVYWVAAGIPVDIKRLAREQAAGQTLPGE